MLKFTQSQFDRLTQDEQAILKKLNFTITPDCPQPLPSSQPIVQSYITMVETSCKLCKSTTVTPFSMEGVGTTLHSRQIQFSEISPDSKVTTRQERTNVCPQCRRQLSLFTKEELIEISINIMKGIH